jgi:uncharacterized membrane protein YbhN (UPF0104 family)
LQFALKVLITSAALYFVFKKVSPAEIFTAVKQANVFYFLLGVLFFNLSKTVSAIRLNQFYNCLQLGMSEILNLRLYYVGMFYNLFLPGSVGGDAYKVYLLRNRKEGTTKQLVYATLLDRLSGLVWLFIMGCLFFYFSSFDSAAYPRVQPLTLLAIALALPFFYLLIKFLFKKFTSVFISTSVLSFFVQAGQVFAAMAILKSIQVDAFNPDYLSLFMLSSVVAVFPFTVGGVGARELVFVYGHKYLNINETAAIAFTLLFFASSAITALIGFFVSFGIEKNLSNSTQA